MSSQVFPPWRDGISSFGVLDFGKYRVAAINPEFFSSFFQMAQHS